jgi:lipoprotein-anchoring transpeptidase ErfK/SrfK
VPPALVLLAAGSLATVVWPAPAPASGRAAEILRVREDAKVRLHSRPGGRTIAILGDRTEYGRRTILAVTGRRGRWAAVTTALVPNGRRAWVRVERRVFARRRTRWRLTADLTDREVTVLHDGRVRSRFAVTIGARGTETPTGRFAITDKLRGRPFGRTYGCCIIALSARQPKVRSSGFDGRMAMHGTTRPDLIGRRGSLGCLRTTDAMLRRLARRVPVGTPVVITR